MAKTTKDSCVQNLKCGEDRGRLDGLVKMRVEKLRWMLDDIVKSDRQDWSDLTNLTTTHRSGAICKRQFIHGGSTDLSITHQGDRYSVCHNPIDNMYLVGNDDVDQSVVEGLLQSVGWIKTAPHEK